MTEAQASSGLQRTGILKLSQQCRIKDEQSLYPCAEVMLVLDLSAYTVIPISCVLKVARDGKITGLSCRGTVDFHGLPEAGRKQTTAPRLGLVEEHQAFQWLDVVQCASLQQLTHSSFFSV